MRLQCQRILVALFTKGRSTIIQLAQYTSVTPRYLRNGLSVLIQQNLVYHQTDFEAKTTRYQANPDACHNIVRFGKILEVIESQYGTAERDLVQTLLLFGFARVADLAQAFKNRLPQSNGHTNGAGEAAAASKLIESEDQLNAVLSRLIQADIIETVHSESFRNPLDVYRDIREEVTRAAPGEKTTKVTMDQESQISDRFKTFKERGKDLKRKLDSSRGMVTKRRKLQNGNGIHLDAVPPINVSILTMLSL